MDTQIGFMKKKKSISNNKTDNYDDAVRLDLSSKSVNNYSNIV